MINRPMIVSVDDEQRILDALQRIFELEDIDCFLTSDPEEALEVLKHESVKIFISDYRMPVMDGVTLLKRAYGVRPDVKRILLTGQAEVDNIVEALNEGHIYRYIAKPWDDAELILAIKEATKMFELEQENKNLLQVTQRQLHDLQALDKLKSDFIANVSHELRTPVNCLNLIIENIVDGIAGDFEDFNPMLQKYVNRAKSNVDNLRAIIDDLLDIFKLSDVSYKLNLDTVDLKPLLSNELDSMSDWFAEKNIILTFESEEELVVCLDRKRFGQVFRNLISNALKFTDDGGSVAVACKKNAGQLMLEVRDSGKGIPSDELKTIFDRFSQVEDKVRGKPVGTGLGLAISHRIIELHGGAIAVESEVGNGSTFKITLPLN